MEKMSEVVKIVLTFLGWVKTILNALGITSLDEKLSNAMDQLA